MLERGTSKSEDPDDDELPKVSRKDSSNPMIDGQLLSALAEYATSTGLGGDSYNPDTAVHLITGGGAKLGQYYNSLSREQKGKISKIYKKFTDLASAAAAADPNLIGIAKVATITDKTAKVDVLLYDKKSDNVKSDIHIKFNDPDRLIGLQGGATLKTEDYANKIGEGEKWPAANKYRWYRNAFAKKYFLDEIRREMKVSPRTKIDSEILAKKLGRKMQGSTTAYDAFKKKGLHHDLMTDYQMRSEFLKYLRDNGLPELILDEIYNFFNQKKKNVYFFKYGSNPDPARFDADNDINLEVIRLKPALDKKSFGIIENLGREEDYGPDPAGDIDPKDVIQIAKSRLAKTTRLYTITYDGQPVYVIEARSGSHPMQLKVYSSRIKLEMLYDIKNY